MSPLKDSSLTPGKESASTTPTARRSKTMPTDSPTAKFLYTIIKQLDLKGIDWTLVASQLEISNGHAARMRYHRFRNQMEGINPTQRKRPANKQSKISTASCKAGFQKETSPEPTRVVKNEPERATEHSSYEPNPHIKAEPCAKRASSCLANIPQYGPPMMSASYPHTPTFPPSIANPYQHMTLAPELRMYSSTPEYPPVPNNFERGNRSPVKWTPMKVEPWGQSEEYKEIDMMGGDPIKREMVEVPVKREVVPEMSMDCNE